MFRKPEIWGGLECTINRIGNEYRSQLEDCGHLRRENDLDEIAKLGITKLRYPVLWESHQRNSEDEHIHWAPVEKQLNKLRRLHIDPIAGLVHHGSGPRFTGLDDPKFGEKLARYARKVATKFPWIENYTPVNEPLTTARFSSLYGLWHPHERSDRAFIRSLLHQLQAVVLAMQEIRQVNPNARLIQTEDMGHTHSCRQLSYQARFENQRKWLTFDLLCGKVDREHSMWNYLQSTGEERLLYFFLQHPTPPNILGLNYYVTSERYLDECAENYPGASIGGNGHHAYVDVEAVRVKKPLGLRKLIQTAWERYHIEPAVTEVHVHCTREEQLRWFKEAWDACCHLCKIGVPVQAVTAWSILGAYDWNSLLTKRAGIYESGVFFQKGDNLRPTALAKLIQTLAQTGSADSPLLKNKGWWHRSYPGAKIKKAENQQPLLIFGSTGTLGAAFIRLCESRNIACRGISRKEADTTKPNEIRCAIERYKPWEIINATGFVKVDDAETRVETCYAVNANAPLYFAELCRAYGIQLMSFSTDLVFDGNKKTPYVEEDNIQPINIYGKSKAKGESLMKEHFADSLIIRTSAFFGPWDTYNFAYFALRELSALRSFAAIDDTWISPTYVPHLVNQSLDLLIDEETGIWHLANDGEITWKEFAGLLAQKAGLTNAEIIGKPCSAMNWKAPRPRFSVITSSKGIHMPTLDHAIGQFFNEKVY